MKQVSYLNPFGKFCCTIGNLPTSYMESLTYEQQLMWFLKFLNDQVIPANNANADAIVELQNALKNLNVEEIVSGELDRLIQEGFFDDIINTLFSDYKAEINGIIQAQNVNINNSFEAQNDNIAQNFDDQNENIEQNFAAQNTRLSNMETQIRAIRNGSPLVASDTSEMTDTSKIYVNTTDGKWYYYDGTNWTIGGTYQSTGLGLGEIKLDNLENALQAGILAYNGTSGAITSTGAIYQGDVGQTISLNANAIWQCGQLAVAEGDMVAINFVIYDTNYSTNSPVFIVDNDNVVLQKFALSDFLETVGSRNLPKKTLLKMPANASKVLFNTRINNNSLSGATQPVWVPVKITEYNYCDSRLTSSLTQTEEISAANNVQGIYSLLCWGLVLSNYYTNIYNVKALDKLNIKATVPDANYVTLALFTDANDNVIGYSRPVGSSGGAQSVDTDIIVPEFATKMYICYRTSQAVPVVSKYVAGGGESSGNNISVSYAGGVLTLNSNKFDKSLIFKNFGGNNLFMIYKYKIENDTYTLDTDMTPAPYIVEAINNANGDRVSTGFTGGNHQWNNQGSGSTATAEQVSLSFYADDKTFISGNVKCDKFTIIETNRVQATNTCLEAGGGRNVLEEKIIFNYDGEKLKVETFITPLEEIKITRYYGLQFVGSNVKLYEKQIFTSTSDLTKKPTMIKDNTGVSMKLYEGGLGDYLYNNGHYAVLGNAKAYYTPIYDNNNTIDTTDTLWLSGEYNFTKNI